MVNEKRKGIVSSPNVNLENNAAANTSRSETTISSPTKMNVKETGVTPESEGMEENASKEVMNEENATRDMENGKIAAEEEKNGETAIEEEEKNEDDPMEEEKEKEPNAIEEEDDAQNATEEEEEEEEAGEEEEEEEEEEQEEDEAEEEKEDNEENRIEQEKNEEKVGASSKEKVKRSRNRNRKKKMAGGGSETVPAKDEDKTGSSSKKKVPKKVESMGMIFMCSSKTKKDCYQYNVLGLPASKRDTVQKVYKGMRLFLFDCDLRLMYGIYKAAGPGGYNIEPKAFKSAFPSQVRFTVLEDCLPLAEEKFKTAIKENYYSRNKFDCLLTSKQVKNLCKLFSISNKGSKSKKLSRNLKAEAHTRVDRGRIRRHGLDEGRRSALVVDRRYRDRPIMYERETFASRAAPLPRRLPPPTATAPYASYGRRTLEMDVYRQEPLVERRDPRLLNLDLRHQDEIEGHSRDLYRQEPVVERRDPRLLNLDLRHQDEIGSHDPYVQYRELPSYRDSLYSVGLPPEYNPPAGLRAEYRPVAGPPPEYLHPAAAPSEYGRLRPLYRY